MAHSPSLCLGPRVGGTSCPCPRLTCTPPAAHVPSRTGKRPLCTVSPFSEPSGQPSPTTWKAVRQVCGCVPPATRGQAHSARVPCEQGPRGQPAFGPGTLSRSLSCWPYWCFPARMNRLPLRKILLGKWVPSPVHTLPATMVQNSKHKRSHLAFTHSREKRTGVQLTGLGARRREGGTGPGARSYRLTGGRPTPAGIGSALGQARRKRPCPSSEGQRGALWSPTCPPTPRAPWPQRNADAERLRPGARLERETLRSARRGPLTQGHGVRAQARGPSASTPTWWLTLPPQRRIYPEARSVASSGPGVLADTSKALETGYSWIWEDPELPRGSNSADTVVQPRPPEPRNQKGPLLEVPVPGPS